MKNESISTKKIVMTAFFAAIIYLGIQSFRIPLPAAVGTPFLHFGHIFVMLAVLMLGPKLSTVAGVLGLVVFDVERLYSGNPECVRQHDHQMSACGRDLSGSEEKSAGRCEEGIWLCGPLCGYLWSYEHYRRLYLVNR